ncbi:MAG: hypothetical protein NTY73_01510 [Candidatus Micrarchaeota archaeon]|nr:hypothetical protein [Candidatus Micrarchaeota archaeon]
MGVLRWLGDRLLSLFILVSLVIGIFLQIYKDFYLGFFVVIIALSIEVGRELGRKRKESAGWGDFADLGLGALFSMGTALLAFAIAVSMNSRTAYIVLLNSALSSMVFLFGSFLRFWRYWRGGKQAKRRGGYGRRG